MTITVIARTLEAFEAACRHPGSIAGEWSPMQQRGTVRFGTEQAAREAVASAGIRETRVSA